MSDVRGRSFSGRLTGCLGEMAVRREAILALYIFTATVRRQPRRAFEGAGAAPLDVKTAIYARAMPFRAS